MDKQAKRDELHEALRQWVTEAGIPEDLVEGLVIQLEDLIEQITTERKLTNLPQ